MDRASSEKTSVTANFVILRLYEVFGTLLLEDCRSGVLPARRRILKRSSLCKTWLLSYFLTRQFILVVAK